MKTPYFTFDRKQLEKNFDAFKTLCKKFFPSFEIAYSVKTNSLKEVLETLFRKGCGFEVASLHELNLVKSFGSFIVFNGPCKTEEELKKALELKALINIDSLSELNKLAKLAKGVEIGIRVDFNGTKFGIYKDKLKEALDYAKKKGFRVIALHSHPGTQKSIKDYEDYLKKWENLLTTVDLKSIKYINIGGGFPDKEQLKNLGCSLEDYFSLIKRSLEPSLRSTTLILEPGRCLVADTMCLITKVHYIKESFKKRYAILDAGINLLPKITLARYKFELLKEFKMNKAKEYHLAGPLLFSNDLLGKFNAELKEGDLIKVKNVGAYCYNLAWELSYKKPKIVVK